MSRERKLSRANLVRLYQLLSKGDLVLIRLFFIYFLLWPISSQSEELNPYEPVVIANGVEITSYDIARYTEFNLQPEARRSGLERERAVLQVIENLYVLRRAEQLAEQQGVLDTGVLDWVAQYERTRYAAIKYFERVKEEVGFTVDWAAKAEEMYLANPAEFQLSEELDLSHILVRIKDKPFDQWVSKLQLIRAALEAGESFEEVAESYSEDQGSAITGGRLGFRGKGQLVAPFEEAAFSLKDVGEISEPVLTQFGFHIIRLNGRKPGSTRPFSEVRPILERAAREQSDADTREAAVLPLKVEVGPSIREVDELAVKEAVLRIIDLDS